MYYSWYWNWDFFVLVKRYSNKDFNFNFLKTAPPFWQQVLLLCGEFLTDNSNQLLNKAFLFLSFAHCKVCPFKQQVFIVSLCRVDCVGILKLRNADVEARIGVAGSKKKSTRARLVFRVNIPRPDGSVLTLQTPSSPILCSKSVSSCLSLWECYYMNSYIVVWIYRL